jgi:curli biogenesis system outer membrane secretion channel CsgG
MIHVKTFFVLVVSLAALAVGGCGKESGQEAPESAARPVSEAPSMARSAPDAGSIERVSVTASGQGPTVQAAVDQAIRLAYEQVNGKAFDAATLNVDAGFEGRFGDASIEASSSAYADVILTQTQGAVSDFRLLSQSESDGVFSVDVEASVEKFERPASASQLRVAVSPLRTDRNSFVIGSRSVAAADVSDQIGTTISQALLDSRRVTILDREFDAEIQQELGRIDAGNWQNNDRLRLGQQLAADFLVVGKIDRFEYTRHTRKMRTSDRELEWYSGGASLTVRVVNVATGQVQFSESFDVQLPETKPTSLGTSVDTSSIVAEMAQSLAAPASQQVVLSLFPITVVDVDGEDIVLSQGGDVVEEGQLYEIVLRGKEIRDPQTGNVLGRIEKPCCQVLVTTVTPEMSYGVLRNAAIEDVSAVFAPGALELRGRVEQPQVAATTPAPQPAAQQPAPAPARQEPPKQAAPEPAPVPEADEDPDW